MLQVRGDLDLGEKALDAEHRAELRLEHLERDLAVVLDVAREVDGRHAAGADLALDLVPASEPAVQLLIREHASGKVRRKEPDAERRARHDGSMDVASTRRNARCRADQRAKRVTLAAIVRHLLGRQRHASRGRSPSLT